jgi:hypothetical protein
MRAPLATWLPGYLATFLLAGCGYTPLYTPNPGDSPAAARLQVGMVEMSAPAHNVGERRVAQAVSQRLQLDYPARNSSFDTLTVTIEEDTSALATQRTAALQRGQINLTGHMQITAPDGTTLMRTALATYSAYNVEDSPYSTESGKSYARLTAARNLAEDISTRIALFYKTRKINPVEVTPLAPTLVTPTEVSVSVPLPFQKLL